MPSTTGDRQTCVDPKAAAAERRRTNKPIMEKKRRQRINDSLNQLKTLVLEALKKDPSRYNKLEKADILEMTVRHVQALHRHQSSSSSSPASSPASNRHASADPATKYRAGFNHCASEVSQFLEKDNTLSGEQRSRILLHLSECLIGFRGQMNASNMNNSSPLPQSPLRRPPPPPPASAVIVDTLPRAPVVAPASVVGSSHSPRANTPVAELLHGHQQPSFTTDPLVMRGVSLVPARLLTGQMAYILPNGVTGVVSAATATAVANSVGDYHHHHHQIPLSPPPSVASPSLSLSSSPPASPCRSPSPQPLDLAPIRHPEDDCCWRPW